MRALRTSLFVLIAAALTLLFPATARAAEYPQVTQLRPFSAEANYMSLPGLVRYLVWAQDGVWLSRGEAVAIVASQFAAAGR